MIVSLLCLLIAVAVHAAPYDYDDSGQCYHGYCTTDEQCRECYKPVVRGQRVQPHDVYMRPAYLQNFLLANRFQCNAGWCEMLSTDVLLGPNGPELFSQCSHVLREPCMPFDHPPGLPTEIACQAKNCRQVAGRDPRGFCVYQDSFLTNTTFSCCAFDEECPLPPSTCARSVCNLEKCQTVFEEGCCTANSDCNSPILPAMDSFCSKEVSIADPRCVHVFDSPSESCSNDLDCGGDGIINKCAKGTCTSGSCVITPSTVTNQGCCTSNTNATTTCATDNVCLKFSHCDDTQTSEETAEGTFQTKAPTFQCVYDDERPFGCCASNSDCAKYAEESSCSQSVCNHVTHKCELRDVHPFSKEPCARFSAECGDYVENDWPCEFYVSRGSSETVRRDRSNICTRTPTNLCGPPVNATADSRFSYPAGGMIGDISLQPTFTECSFACPSPTANSARITLTVNNGVFGSGFSAAGAPLRGFDIIVRVELHGTVTLPNPTANIQLDADGIFVRNSSPYTQIFNLVENREYPDDAMVDNGLFYVSGASDGALIEFRMRDVCNTRGGLWPNEELNIPFEFLFDPLVGFTGFTASFELVPYEACSLFYRYREPNCNSHNDIGNLITRPSVHSTTNATVMWGVGSCDEQCFDVMTTTSATPMPTPISTLPTPLPSPAVPTPSPAPTPMANETHLFGIVFFDGDGDGFFSPLAGTGDQLLSGRTVQLVEDGVVVAPTTLSTVTDENGQWGFRHDEARAAFDDNGALESRALFVRVLGGPFGTNATIVPPGGDRSVANRFTGEAPFALVPNPIRSYTFTLFPYPFLFSSNVERDNSDNSPVSWGAGFSVATEPTPTACDPFTGPYANDERLVLSTELEECDSCGPEELGRDAFPAGGCAYRCASIDGATFKQVTVAHRMHNGHPTLNEQAGVVESTLVEKNIFSDESQVYCAEANYVDDRAVGSVTLVEESPMTVQGPLSLPARVVVAYDQLQAGQSNEFVVIYDVCQKPVQLSMGGGPLEDIGLPVNATLTVLSDECLDLVRRWHQCEPNLDARSCTASEVEPLSFDVCARCPYPPFGEPLPPGSTLPPGLTMPPTPAPTFGPAGADKKLRVRALFSAESKECVNKPRIDTFLCYNNGEEAYEACYQAGGERTVISAFATIDMRNVESSSRPGKLVVELTRRADSASLEFCRRGFDPQVIVETGSFAGEVDRHLAKIVDSDVSGDVATVRVDFAPLARDEFVTVRLLVLECDAALAGTMSYDVTAYIETETCFDRVACGASAEFGPSTTHNGTLTIESACQPATRLPFLSPHTPGERAVASHRLVALGEPLGSAISSRRGPTAEVGIVLGVLAMLVVCALCALFVRRRPKKSKTSKSSKTVV